MNPIKPAEKQHADADAASDALKSQFEAGDRLSSRNLYGKRVGRPLRQKQLDRLENMLPKLSFSMDRLPLDKPIWLEIGFGAGEHMAWQAKQNPDVCFIGVEFFANGVAKALEHIEVGGLENVLIHHGDARDVLDQMENHRLENHRQAGKACSLERVFILHPDPWPKRRHWERRIVQIDFISRIVDLMRPGHELRIATDHQSYLTWILRIMQQVGSVRWTAESAPDWRDQKPDWPQTRYEAKGLREGRPATYLSYKKHD